MANLERPFKRGDPSSEVSGKVSPEKAKSVFGFVVMNSNEASHCSESSHAPEQVEKRNVLEIT